MDAEKPNATELFSEWQRLEDLPKFAPDKFVSYEAAYHVWRNNRDRLIEADAVTTIAGRLYFHPERFERAIVAIGMERTKGRGAG